MYDFFDALLHKDDRWSWMCDKEYYVADETGVITGTWGVSLGQAVEYYHDYGLRVRYIYPGSPFEQYGVTRGAVLTHINGQNVEDLPNSPFTNEKLKIYQENFYKSPQKFTFRLVDGRDTTFTATILSELRTRTNLITRIIQPEEFPGLNAPVGYFLYMAFKANFLDDIAEPMTYFHNQGIRNLIVDLRYNGGGDSRASDTLMTYLAPKSAQGKPYVIRKHNSYLGTLDDSFKDENNTYNIGKNAASLDLDRIYFITGPGTASASEMVMNGLKPYMGDKLQMVGDTTYGKPNGMYVLMYPGSNSDYEAYNKGNYTNLKWVFLPIAFFNQNSRGESIPWDGFVPNNYRPDDLYHDFGVDESDIKACLTHMVSGTWPALPSATQQSVSTKAGKPRYRIDTEEDRAGYGRYTVQKTDF
jgi:C-terminal processing protease CtpA/Prc